MKWKYDITLLTDRRYLNPEQRNDYIDNVLLEDELVRIALEAKGLRVHRINWDDERFDWTSTRFALFRATWDYFERYEEFWSWFESTRHLTNFLNSPELIRWNIDKHYLLDLETAGIAIPPTQFVEPEDQRSLQEIFREVSWPKAVLKPAVSGGARHTYVVTPESVNDIDPIFRSLIENESMLLQEFQQSILSEGEVTFVLFGTEYSHAVLKKAKPGDFRVQDDFGGTVHPYHATDEEKAFAKQVIEACPYHPVYSRVDAIHDNHGALVVSEVEMIEPELWFRMDDRSAQHFAEHVMTAIQSTGMAH